MVKLAAGPSRPGRQAITTMIQQHPILQERLRYAPWAEPGGERLPGTRPLDPGDWLIVDEAYGAQMELRETLIAGCQPEVHALRPEARAAARELLDGVLAVLAGRADFNCGRDEVTCPDGRRVRIDSDAPLLTLGRLVQADFCILQPGAGGHVLKAAILCFPASWTLAEKLDKPLGAIHRPVASYDEGLERRVQRLFDAIRPERPLWRANVLTYRDPSLFQPRREAYPREEPAGTAEFVRSERQVLSRLRETGAVVFSIHTSVLPKSALNPAQAAALERRARQG